HHIFLFFLYCSSAHRYLHSFPTRRSSDLVGVLSVLSLLGLHWSPLKVCVLLLVLAVGGPLIQACRCVAHVSFTSSPPTRAGRLKDRKSTRLNSSHDQISYAVFCLKKKI